MRDLLSKTPWARVLPGPEGSELRTDILTQDDFIRQYYPSAHRIHDEGYYPDILRAVEEPAYDADGNETGTTRRIYKERVPRFAFAFQQVITAKQLVHLCGNDIQFDLNTDTADKTLEETARQFRDGWQEKGMEHVFYEFAKSVKTTGDGAVVGFLEDGRFGAVVLSARNGDRLYPHYGRNGQLSLFARRYREYDPEGNAVDRIEVWDDRFLWYLRSANASDPVAPVHVFGTGLYQCRLEGFVLEAKRAHGFDRVPVVYMRDDDGPCWAPAQNSIDEYELAFSQMAQNNKAFGEPIMYLQGENVEALHDIDGSIKILTMGPEDKAGYLESQSASESFLKELDDLHDRIYEQCFVVKPPELKSGDLPAAALRILYSPAVEFAMNDAQKYYPPLRRLVFLFAYGFGVESEGTLDFINLPLVTWIKPYIHLVESSVVSDLATAVQNRFLSRQTATERISFYSQENEWERITAEEKAEEKADILAEYERSRFEGE